VSYGIKINLPSNLAVDDNSVPFSFIEVLELAISTPSGSKTYTGYEGINIKLYQISSTDIFSSGTYFSRVPLPHTLTVTNNGIEGVAPTLNWSTTLPVGNGTLIKSTVYVVGT
jgi:hypothetical protein